nr:hypothetical protein CFP56_52072 [Quercus suber]
MDSWSKANHQISWAETSFAFLCDRAMLDDSCAIVGRKHRVFYNLQGASVKSLGTVNRSILTSTWTRPAQVRWKEKASTTNHKPTQVKLDRAQEAISRFRQVR